MDPVTVIAVLAAHLFSAGGLLYLVGRRMPPRSGILFWASGLMLFGLAYGLRLVVGLHAQLALAPLLDGAMIASALLLVAGLREFAGRDALDRRSAAYVMLVCVGLEALAIVLAGALGRYVVLNLELGLLYSWQALDAVGARRRVENGLRQPLLLTATIAGLLGALTLVRGLHIASHGAEAVYGGGFAQAYYGFASIAAGLFAMSLLWAVFARLNGQLVALATLDALTRVLNRSGLDAALRRHFGARNAPPLTLLAIDVDDFKRINDSHGHATGDLVLRAVADTLARHVRPSEFVARVGGEEFVVCTAAGSQAALALAERLREAAAALATLDSDGRAGVRCTLSIGVSAPFASLDARPRAEAEADRALYAAKRAGRNRVQEARGEAATA